MRGHGDLLVLLALVTVISGRSSRSPPCRSTSGLRTCTKFSDAITAYISVASKTASFALLLRLLLTVFWPVRLDWEMLVAGVAIASLTVGTSLRSHIEYQAYVGLLFNSHVGYILLGIVAAASSAQGFMTGMKGVAFYLFVYDS